LVIWLQAVTAYQSLYFDGVEPVLNKALAGNYTTGGEFAGDYNFTLYAGVYAFVPKGTDASKEIMKNEKAMFALEEAYDALLVNGNNETAQVELVNNIFDAFSAATKSLFDSLSVSIPKQAYSGSKDSKEPVDPDMLFASYVGVFELVFMYVFIAGGAALLLITALGALSLPAHQRKPSTYIRLGIQGLCGVGLCLISTLKYNWDLKSEYLGSAWMIPTICLVLFGCVIAQHVRLPGKDHTH
jgi:hypothetical protein